MKAILLAACLGACATALHAAEIESYPMPAVYEPSQNYALEAGGKAVPVVRYTPEYDYAEFSMGDGPCVLKVKNLKGPAAGVSISPLRLGIDAKVDGDAATFTVKQSAYLILSVGGNRNLVIAVDAPETGRPSASGPGIFNVTAAPFNADPAGAALATPAIQGAIDAASAAGTPEKPGIVYVPAGVYPIGSIVLKSNVELYLAGGSVLRGTANPDDYHAFFHKTSQKRDGTWFVYTAQGAHDMKVCGRGTIDGNGKALEQRHFGIHLLLIVGCSNFTLDGPILRDSDAWAMVTGRSHDLRLQNYKLFNYVKNMGENDGIDVCDSRNVAVRHAISICLDDSFSTKTWANAGDVAKNWYGDPLPDENISFDDCVAWTRCFGYKIGQGVNLDQRNISFTNSVVYDCAVGFGIHHKWGTAAVQGATFDGIDVERVNCVNVGQVWADFFVDDTSHKGGGPLSDIVVRNITVRDKGKTPVRVAGLSDYASVKNVLFENIVMPGQKAPAKTLDEIGPVDQAFATDVRIEAK